MNSWKDYVLLLLALTLAAAVLVPKAKSAYSSPVTVMNTPAGSVPVWLTDNDGRNVVRLRYLETMPAGQSDSIGPTGYGVPLRDAANDPSSTDPYVVPVGKRLVIDYTSMFAFPPPGQTVDAYFYNGFTYTAFEITPHPSFAGHGGTAVRDYVEPGQSYRVSMFRDSTANAMFWEAYVVGHLVDCTNGGGC